MLLRQQASTGSSLNNNAQEGTAQVPATVVAEAIPGQQSVKWFRGGPAS
jgi:hypothetical protein